MYKETGGTIRQFRQNIDKRSRQATTEYLRKHFRYNTANNWNRGTSYAVDLKIHHLGLPGNVADKLYELIQTQDFYKIMTATPLFKKL